MVKYSTPIDVEIFFLVGVSRGGMRETAATKQQAEGKMTSTGASIYLVLGYQKHACMYAGNFSWSKASHGQTKPVIQFQI